MGQIGWGRTKLYGALSVVGWYVVNLKGAKEVHKKNYIKKIKGRWWWRWRLKNPCKRRFLSYLRDSVIIIVPLIFSSIVSATFLPQDFLVHFLSSKNCSRWSSHASQTSSWCSGAWYPRALQDLLPSSKACSRRRLPPPIVNLQPKKSGSPQVVYCLCRYLSALAGNLSSCLVERHVGFTSVIDPRHQM